MVGLGGGVGGVGGGWLLGTHWLVVHPITTGVPGDTSSARAVPRVSLKLLNLDCKLCWLLIDLTTD
jgi:hypothetical protein